jgi:hypothetical protein
LALIIFVKLDAKRIHPLQNTKRFWVKTKKPLTEVISKIGFGFKIPSSPREKHGFAETGAAPTKVLVRHWRIGPKGIFEITSNIRFMNSSYKNKIPVGSLPHR